jgi:predicted lactoylglutathione lyase
MPKMIFISLPVADIAASTAFYEAIGFEKNARFSNEHSSSMVWSDAIYVILLAKPFFATFTEKRIVAARTNSTGHYALSFDSRDEVDAITRAAVEAGGRELHEPQDLGFMYSRAFEDLGGQGFGPFWMDPAAVEGGAADNP